MKKNLITGGAGFIGYHLAKRLAEQDNYVVVADNLSGGKKDVDLEMLLINPNVRMIACDLTDPTSYEKMGSGYDAVYHLAGINGFRQFMEIPHEVLRVGVSATLNILEWFRSHNKNPDAKILFASSNEVFTGALDAFGTLPIPTPEDAPLVMVDPYNPRWSYAGSKLIGELLFLHYAKAYGFRMVVARLHNLYGPRAGYHPMIPKFIERIQNHADPFPIFGPNDLRTSCYIADAVEAMQTAVESPATDGQIYHIGSSHETTIKNLLEIMFKIMQWHPRTFDIKNFPNGSMNRDVLDVSKIQRDTGWEAKTSLKDGLRKTIEWYIAHPHQTTP